MNGNIACSVPGCQEAVIGQCQGHNGPCGRFYCAKHSRGRLCDECATVAEAEQLYKEYENDAQQVLRGPIGTGVWLLIALGIIAFGIIMGIALKSATAYVICMLVPFFAVLYSQDVARKKRLAEMCVKRENFEEFYKQFQRKHNKSAMGLVGGIAIAAILGAMSPEAQAERDIAHIRSRIDRL